MAQPRGLLWRLAEVVEVATETPRTKSLVLEVPGWEGHRAGQHVDVRLRAPDGYTAQRSYSVASAPEDERLVLTVDRLDDGEVFSFGVTTAEYTCRGRGRGGRVGAATDHEARGLGMVVRCPRLRQRPDPARHRPRAALDRPDEGMRYVQVGNGDG